ncbi:hypothetical protein S7711_00459 [Stachybotrys chartarum IBT 7711]|uniref:F-box domain-containing protein n=1 Tax=Stachybotrys chartarum (strain CBS 109288 / IBT 7711) TaxID=1280523 RepID=A0A084B9S3_STACB|nr:hypothetical protein S7711_00459 [Stachybotrys chartarum IBT 7711]
MANPRACIANLPIEILDTILTPLTTKELLPMAPVSARFYGVITRLIHRRLMESGPLPANDLLLECYLPSAKLTTPSLSCRYLGDRVFDGASLGDSPSLPALRNMYSAFRPSVSQEDCSYWWQRPRGSSSSTANAGKPDDAAFQEIHLDEGMSFSQLCATTNVVKVGTRSGVFLRHVNISDGVVRLSRHWLARMASDGANARAAGTCLGDDDTILWVDQGKDVGLRFSVHLAPSFTMPLISGPYDDPPVWYNLVYEEILVRTNKLVLAVESAAHEEVSSSSNAVVIIGM